MLIQLSRRILGFGISSFALLGFLAVPLGDKTGFQHARALLGSEEAQRLGTALRSAALEARQRVGLDLLERLSGHLGDLRAPRRHRPTGSSPADEPAPAPERPQDASGPKAHPPDLPR